LLVTIGCGDVVSPYPEPRIVLERAERPGYWRATYALSGEADFLCFQRPAAFYRESGWSVTTPGWSFARLGDRQTLVAKPGSSTEQVVVEFPVYTDVLAKEYEFFQSFTDGSVAIYSGHLYASPTDGVCPEGTAWHEATPETTEELLGLIAHEAVHLWNGQLRG